MKIILLFLAFCSSVWSLEEGILKLDQEIKDPIIVDQYPGALTIKYCVDCIKDQLHGASLIERPSLDSETSKEAESLSSTEIEKQPIWAVDLSGTYMPESDFRYFMQELSPDFTHLKILILNSVSLFELTTWELLFPYLQQENFKYIDVCGTHLSTSNIVPILETIKGRFPSDWEQMTQKIIFAQKSYYKRLKKEVQWPKDCIEQEILSERWFDIHSLYYGETEKKMHRKIQKAAPLHCLSGDSDYDQEYEMQNIEDSLDVLSFRDEEEKE